MYADTMTASVDAVQTKIIGGESELFDLRCSRTPSYTEKYVTYSLTACRKTEAAGKTHTGLYPAHWKDFPTPQPFRTDLYRQQHLAIP